MDKQEVFLFYRSFYEATKNLPADLYKEIMIALMEYALNGERTELSPMADCAFQLIKPQIDANNRRRENGNKGGRPKKETEQKAKETEPEPNRNQNETKPKPNQNQTETKPKPNKESIKVKDKSKYISNPLDNITAEPVADAPAQADCEAIPLNDGTEWKPTEERFAEYERLYPGIDVKQKFREMRGWCLSNPSRRKTRRGVEAFVTGWLGREQNRAPARGQPSKRNRFHNLEEHGTDYDSLMWSMVGGT